MSRARRMTAIVGLLLHLVAAACGGGAVRKDPAPPGVEGGVTGTVEEGQTTPGEGTAAAAAAAGEETPGTEAVVGAAEPERTPLPADVVHPDSGSPGEAAPPASAPAADASAPAAGEPAPATTAAGARKGPAPAASRAGSASGTAAGASPQAQPQAAPGDAPSPARTAGRGQGKATYVFSTAGKKAPVTFDHRAHQGRAACTTCHHTSRAGEAMRACSGCHDAGAAAGAPPRKEVFHKRCRSCHQDRGGPTQCGGCHR